MAPQYRFNSIIQKASNTNISLRYSLLEVFGEKLGEKEV